MAVCGVTSTGAMDTTFGTNGYASAGTEGSSYVGFAGAMAPGGDFVVVGAASTGSAMAVARFSSDGVWDTSFGTDGIFTKDFLFGEDRAAGVAVQADDKIVVVGQATIDADLDAAVIRLTTDGELDTTFGLNGAKTFDFGGDSMLNGVAVQPDGRIVVAGYGALGGAEIKAFGVARLFGNEAQIFADGFGWGSTVLWSNTTAP
jgi:uncharacterized delta-60 repeat protein